MIILFFLINSMFQVYLHTLTPVPVLQAYLSLFTTGKISSQVKSTLINIFEEKLIHSFFNASSLENSMMQNMIRAAPSFHQVMFFSLTIYEWQTLIVFLYCIQLVKWLTPGASNLLSFGFSVMTLYILIKCFLLRLRCF